MGEPTLRPCRFPCASPDDPVRLAKQTHSLARFSKRTTEHRLPLLPTVPSRAGRFAGDLSCPVAPSPPEFRPYCTSLLRVLFSVRSRYLFAIGLGECLALAVDACHIHEGFPTPATPDLTHAIVDLVTGFSPCITLRSRRLHEKGQAMIAGPIHHIGRSLQFGLCRVHSRLLTISRLISFPTGTKMFQFPAFPIARSNCGGDSHSDILCSSLPCSSHRLIAAWHVLRRRSSRAIHQLAQ